uniref:Hyaluronidase n=1 Tax=Paramormyrops kingsleyae TaxID=1676925 RepID=A0A3B3SLE3_9TELE|nr:hyaluronidase-4-like [Paramormyrops kingsleyae]
MPKVTPWSTNPHAVHITHVLTILAQVAFALKPAKLPLIGRKPFIAAWNAPLDMCVSKYNVSIDLSLFHIQGSPRAVRTGQDVTIFYANRLGHYPFYTEQGMPVNGGLPQNCSLKSHLHKAHRDIRHYIPSRDFHGLAVIDWEYWRPQWNRNWHKKDIYRRKSREMVWGAYTNMSEAQVEELARHGFEERAAAFMQETLTLGMRTRPLGLWGFYLYPDCHNYNVDETNYTGTCPLQERRRNDELLWLWNSSTALYPSVAIRRRHADNDSNLHFSRCRVLESLRIASLTSLDYELPTFVYTRMGYREEAMTFLTTKDLVHTIGESAALGAAGFVIWGSLNLTSSRHNCSKVKAFLGRQLGQYIMNVTRAAEICSDFLCQGGGRCVRRDPHASHYLHLSSESYRIDPTGDGRFAVVGWHTDQELQQLLERFRCHCYQGYGGDHCDSLATMVESSARETGTSVALLLALLLNLCAVLV